MPRGARSYLGARSGLLAAALLIGVAVGLAARGLGGAAGGGAHPQRRDRPQHHGPRHHSAHAGPGRHRPRPGPPARSHRTPRTRPAPTDVHPRHPNIVFVLTDDLATNLVRYMPAVQAMEQDGETFDDYFVSDSLCCPSRASIFTGNFPHDTGVHSNEGPRGGFRAFHARGELRHTFAAALQASGYRTAMMGKFLNGYLDPREGGDGVPASFVAPDWNEWDVAGWGYPEYDYQMNQDGHVRFYGHKPRDYLTDVLARLGVGFIDTASRSGDPFFLELAPFAPHTPYTPAPKYAHAFPGLQAPRPPDFDVLPTDAPAWLAGRPPLTAPEIAAINAAFRKRVESVQSVDDMIEDVERALVANHVANDTYIFFSSDNGLHMGEYRLLPGKMTAFDTDIHVPLIVTGPGVPPDTHTDAMTENVDLAKTFAGIAGRRFPSDGHSLLALLRGHPPRDWRNAILVEHTGPNLNPADPDFQYQASGNPITYEAMRTDSFLYVAYKTGAREFYDLRTDPYELHNIYADLSPRFRRSLQRQLLALKHCHDGPACWRAGHVEPRFVRRVTVIRRRLS
jgi:N-acetylglucosamine-6-sulfatase